jgi:hypothetical protein
MVKHSNPAAGSGADRSDGAHAAPQSEHEKATAPSIGQRIVAVIVFVLSAAMLIACLAVGVGVWVVKPRATAKATTVFGRIEAALDVADENLGQVQASLARASERLDSARQEQQKLAQEPQPNSALTRMVARSVLPRVAPDLGNAQEKLHNVAEAAVVVNSVLEDVGNFPLLSVTGLDVDRLTEMNSRLADVGPAAWELSRLLGDPGDSDTAGSHVSRIERTLQTVQASIAEYQPRLADVRQRSEALESRTLHWMTPGSILITLACLWIGLSQVSVMTHARSWWGRSACAAAAVRASQANPVVVA